PSGRDRLRHPSRHHQRRARADRRTREGEPGAAQGQPDPEGGERVFRPGARSAAGMTRFIQERSGRFGVELLCRTLGASPSTYYGRRNRPPSARAITDAWFQEEIARVFEANYRVYGA